MTHRTPLNYPTDTKVHQHQPSRARFDRDETNASRVLKFLISLAFYAVAEGWRALRRIAGTPASSAVAIYYHHVTDDGRHKFARQIDHLMRWTEPLRTDGRRE